MIPPEPGQPADQIAIERAWFIAGGAALLVLATYLWLAGYAYPTSDDWCFASSGRGAGIGTAVADYWRMSGGRWLTACLLFGLGSCPDLTTAYPLLITATFGIAIAACWLLTGLLGISGPKARVPATVILMTILIVALPILDVGDIGPHAATPETLYWASGAWPYSLAFSLVVLGAWVATRQDPAWIAWTACAGLGIAVSGLSEMAGLLGMVVGTALGLGGCRRGWILAAAAGIGFGIAASAPGNLKRLEIIGHDPNQSFGMSNLPGAAVDAARFTLIHLRDWLLNPAVATACIALFVHGSSLAAAPAPWRRRAALTAAAVVAGVWTLAMPSLTLVGFLEARHEGLVSFAAVAGILIAATLAGRGWAGVPAEGRWRIIAAAWVLVAAASRWWHPLPISPCGAWADLLALGLLIPVVIGAVRGNAVLLGTGLAVALLAQPAWWQAISDGAGKAPALLRLQRLRDQTIRELVAGGTTEIILPWIGQHDRLPRTLRIYEVQSGWMADGYAQYFGITRYRFSTKVPCPVPWPRPPAR